MGIEPMTFILPKLSQILSSWFLETPLCVYPKTTLNTLPVL